ncbi:MAG: hypothetical protein ACD_43C00130G0003 [uncultured bacterium]|nr:MAG: hypothetical protein ACD_43C00130G0003 [uncultured bacterium]
MLVFLSINYRKHLHPSEHYVPEPAKVALQVIHSLGQYKQ